MHESAQCKACASENAHEWCWRNTVRWFDEDLHEADFVNAHQEGYDNVELLKRYTTVGMGPSQGKLANMNAIRILARLNGRSINETGSTTSRPFHQPVSLNLLAGRRFHPMRRTPMHDWHAAAGANFTFAGAWYRPEFYAVPGSDPAQVILDEARSVRESVGLIDVGTLGETHPTVIGDGRLGVVDEDYQSFGLSGEVVATVTDRDPTLLKAPVQRVAVPDVPIPYSHVLEYAVLPRPERIEEAVRRVVAG